MKRSKDRCRKTDTGDVRGRRSQTAFIVFCGDVPRSRRATSGRGAGGSPRRRRVPPASCRSVRRSTPRRPTPRRPTPRRRRSGPVRSSGPAVGIPGGRLGQTATHGSLPHAPNAHPATLPTRPDRIVLVRSTDSGIDRQRSHCATSDGSTRGGTNVLCFPGFPAEADRTGTGAGRNGPPVGSDRAQPRRARGRDGRVDWPGRPVRGGTRRGGTACRSW